VDEGRIIVFREAVWSHYRRVGRSFPWRETTEPYRILVSEVMLQQTQTARVVGRYQEFLDRFPDLKALATASLQEVLILWQGLGYNRRAKALRETASVIMERYHGVVPDNEEALRSLPGIGPYTAGAVVTFAFGRPAIFLETNIRSALLATFFEGRVGVTDKELLPLVAATLDQHDPRRWYWALMDYGVAVKDRVRSINAKQSAHHRPQGRFEGSRRQLRGGVIRALTHKGALTFEQLALEVTGQRARLEESLRLLCQEGLVRAEGRRYRIA
jgi:A/G-specific adenine glycosylase